MPSVGADGRYRLLRCLGRGGMGEVHLASCRGAAGFEKLVALKLLDDRSARDPTRAHTLIREAFLGVQLDHEGIVSVLDFGESEHRYFVVMEYVRGFTLAHVLAHLDDIGQSLPVNVALHVARALLDALAYLHQLRGSDGTAHLVHGDVSPSNLLLAGDGRIKLSDFGVAGLVGDIAERGRIAGKLPYLPPEAFAGADRAQTWDVYAAAALLYEALAGVPAFPGTSVDAIRQALRKGAPSLAAHRPDVPPRLARVIEQTLSFHGERRPSTAIELRDAIDRAVPRQVEDATAHRALIASVYGDSRFVQRHGQLPSTDGVSLTTEPALGEVASTDVAVPTAGRVRTRALRFGVTPAMGAARAREVGERFTAYLGTQLGREVRPVVLADYAMLVACLVEGEIDLAWMPPTSFIAAAEHGAGILAKVRRAGQTTYQSALFRRRDRGIASLSDLRGQPMAWVDVDSASGYLYAAAELRRALGDLDQALGEQHFVGSHSAVCEAVVRGWAAAGATYASRDAAGEVVSSGWKDSLRERSDQVEALWFSAPIPGDSIASRPFLSEALTGSLSRALLAMGDSADGRALLSEVFNAEALVAAAVRDYDGVRSALDP